MNIQITKDAKGYSFWPADVKLEKNYCNEWVDADAEVRGTMSFDQYASELVLGRPLDNGERVVVDIRQIS